VGPIQDLVGKLGGGQGPANSLPEFVGALVAAAVLSAVLAAFYARFGRSLANRRAFAANFVPITVTTMFIITVVRSSLALSLGLVGALSIVRFRTAIREPEELIYLFVCIGLGLGFGANQGLLAVVAFAALLVILLLAGLIAKRGHASDQGLFVIIQGPAALELPALETLMKRHCRRTALRRFDASAERTEASYSVEMASQQALPALAAAVRALPARLMIIDQHGKTLE
jgi:hypothetical protein